ncbi:MAG: tRNA (guanosine(46)-N7)-methyltransferase TrmB [Actinobacteria bacterium]|uniref:tRNA (guanine(46)-N(7))-methyltransferase n=1 Tax=freshwater metagenome TaxID=449393 RepID=A0A6J7I5G7_9ZZZZ|nr:tRNA (guanosine(46)-N7)-methyltransferase TrmB [Actinomycetota bacterium]MSX25346.1 tRNA (guanosine(46)-N7)-methyltransferase TrmB [Actinomycetota bacterium]MSY46036.1 tRNA (guanosine(46)-N7)-methyltransferase TrmB [Actinomycetota bacterium]MSY57617.1 tRNA (guanosine(46)-N7)-methyltransferase TrmB [Actinomycetota bacterium]MTB00722.1 tRNA (guanosine(46)-N7)-methyltransferase TrmB [Actinomycetota bacterium]
MESPTIKSFKLRGTRITVAQVDARNRLWPEFGIDYAPKALNLSELLPASEGFVIEIGFGMGEATIEIAKNFPQLGFLAIDVHQPGIGKVLSRIETESIANIRVMDEDAHLVLAHMIADGSLDAIHLFFPDPWPKVRHHKRRIVNEDFIALAASKLKVDGVFQIATDWQPYATWIAEKFASSNLFIGGEVPRPQWRPLTRFENQGITKKHRVTDFSYKKV